MNDDDRALRQLLLDRIRQSGPMTFARFMEACLYEPGLGYYTSPGRKVGAGGDFYTSSNVHALFGRLLAREICRMWQELGRPDTFQVVEMGAGGGRLACDIMDGIRDLAPEFYRTVTCRLIEKEPSLRAAQQALLHEHEARLAWSTPEELVEGSITFTGCLVSNELVDALPVHLVEMTDAGLQEVFVTADGEEFREIPGSPSTPALAAYLERISATLGPGQRAEIRLAALDWLTAVVNALERGFVLTIDYGYLAPELYGPMRKNGTLLCYYRHTVEENTYIRVGLQDMTAHVDFTTLSRFGEGLGLCTVWYGEQYRFLMATGMMQELAILEARATSEAGAIKDRLALKKLMLPDGGMGDTFKVLVQAKGVTNPQLLCLGDWASAL